MRRRVAWKVKRYRHTLRAPFPPSAAARQMVELVECMVHSIDMTHPQAAFAFQGAQFIDSMFRRCTPEARVAILNGLTASKSFMQGVANIVTWLSDEVLAEVQAADPTFRLVEPGSPSSPVAQASRAASGSGADTGLRPHSKSSLASFKFVPVKHPLVPVDVMPHGSLLKVQAVGQWLWATVWLVDENQGRAADVTSAFHASATTAAVRLLVLPGLPANVRDDRLVPLLERLVRQAGQAQHQTAFVKGLLGTPYTLHCLMQGPTEGLPGLDLISTKAWVVELMQACVTGCELAALEYVARDGMKVSDCLVRKYILQRKRSARDEPDICGRVCAHTASTISFIAKKTSLRVLALEEDVPAALAVLRLSRDMLQLCIRIRHMEGVLFALSLASDLLLVEKPAVLACAVHELDLPHHVARAAHWFAYRRRGDPSADRLASTCALFFKNMANGQGMAQNLTPLMTVAMLELVLCSGKVATEASAAVTKFRTASPSNESLMNTVRFVERWRPGCLFLMDDTGLSCAVAGRHVRSSAAVFGSIMAAFVLLVVLLVCLALWAYLSAFGLA